MKSRAVEKKSEQVPTKTVNRHTYTPKVDICESTEEYLIEAEMPGVDKKNIDVKFEDGLLTILGRVLSDNLEGYKKVYSEYDVGNFERVFEISEDIDVAKIQAVIKSGILKIVLQKKEALRPKRIEVRAE